MNSDSVFFSAAVLIVTALSPAVVNSPDVRRAGSDLIVTAVLIDTAFSSAAVNSPDELLTTSLSSGVCFVLLLTEIF